MTTQTTDTDAPVVLYQNNHFKVRAMLTTRYVWMEEQPDGSLLSVPASWPGAERRHAVLRAGVEARYGLPFDWDGKKDLADVGHAAEEWHTLKLIEFSHPLVAPPGRVWRAVVEGEIFRLEHVSEAAQ